MTTTRFARFFSAKATDEFKNKIEANADKNKKYGLAATITTNASAALVTGLAAIQIAVDNTNPDNKTTIDNIFTPLIGITMALSIVLTRVFGYLQNQAESEISNMTIEGLRNDYFDIKTPVSGDTELSAVVIPHPKPAMLSTALPYESDLPGSSNDLSVTEQLLADGLVRRFTH